MRIFYYQTSLLGHACPTCGGRLRMRQDGAAVCTQYNGQVDPTACFQSCHACGGRLKRLVSHYVCALCGVRTRSRFAFDPAIFDPAYFSGMMHKSRQRHKKRIAKMRERLLLARSEGVLPDRLPNINDVPDLAESLDAMAGFPLPAEFLKGFLRGPGLDIQRYRRHIINSVGAYEARFDNIPSLLNDRRRDRIFRFVTVVHMCHEREIKLVQQDEILVVMRREPDDEGQGIP